MVSVASSAHIKLTGFHTEGVDAYSPLEEQVTLTYRAAYHYASANGFEPYTHRGVEGRRGPMIMKRITDSLFDHPDKDVRSKLNGLVTQVLRKTDAVVCVKRPVEGDRESMPEWFIANSMPPNLTIVALSHAHKDKTASAPSRTSGAGIIPTYAEQRLSAQEAGENMPPGEVTVSHKPERTPEERIAPLKDFLDNRTREHEEFREEVYRLVAAHAPVGGQELKYIMGRPDTKSTSSVAALKELAEAGRIVSRIEDDDERMIRGGGSGLPKGKRMLLWAIAPGPVPKRTALPPGVQPRLSGVEWGKLKKEKLDKLCDTVLDVLQQTYPAGTPRPRSIGTISEAAGLSHEDTRSALDRLISLDMVYMNDNYCYFLAERKRPPKPATTEPVIPRYANGSPEQEAAREAARVASQAPDGVDQPSAHTPVAPLSLLEDIAELIQRHAGDGQRVEQLQAQLVECQATIAKQAKIITGLRATVAAYEDE